MQKLLFGSKLNSSCIFCYRFPCSCWTDHTSSIATMWLHTYTHTHTHTNCTVLEPIQVRLLHWFLNGVFMNCSIWCHTSLRGWEKDLVWLDVSFVTQNLSPINCCHGKWRSLHLLQHREWWILCTVSWETLLWGGRPSVSPHFKSAGKYSSFGLSWIL